MSDRMRFAITITVLTPLHIGSGQRLREGFDFISHQGYVYIANQARLMDAMLDEAVAHQATPPPLSDLAAKLIALGLAPAAPTASEADPMQLADSMVKMTLQQFYNQGWLRSEHFDPTKGLFHYRLKGSTSTTQKEGELYEQIKDVYGRPYLPGSSLKGALRSALLREAAASDSSVPTIYPPHGQSGREQQRGEARNERFVAQAMEARHFVPSNAPDKERPNFDLWRAVHVADSSPVPVSQLALASVRVFRTSTGQRKNAGKRDITIDIEALMPQTQLTALLTVDTWLFNDPRAARLGFTARHLAHFTSDLCRLVNRDARARIAEELDFLNEVVDPSIAAPARARLQSIDMAIQAAGELEMFLQVGRFAGWRSKTLGRVLQEKLPADEFARIVTEFNLGRGTWKQNECFPYTRQLVTLGAHVNLPMGWVKISLEAIP